MTDAKTNQPKSFLERDDWLRAVNASDLPHVAVRIAVAIGLHLHVRTGRCDPSFAGIAADSRMSERSVYRLVALLEHRGWIATQRTGGRFRNQYVLLNPDKAQTGFNPDKAQTGFDDANPDKAPSGSTLTESASNPDTTVADKKRRTTKKERRGKSQTLALDVASLDLGDDAPTNPDRKKDGDDENVTIFSASADQVGDDENVTSLKPEDPDADHQPHHDNVMRFADFWSAYPRKRDKDDARKAFAAAIKRGADPAALIEGAKRYANERAGQDPKYTKHPATWLNKGSWLDEPGAPVTIDEHGNVIDTPQPRRSREQTDEEILSEVDWERRR